MKHGVFDQSSGSQISFRFLFPHEFIYHMCVLEMKIQSNSFLAHLANEMVVLHLTQDNVCTLWYKAL